MRNRKRIKTLDGLLLAWAQRKSVICPNSPCFNKPRPAAFIINLTGQVLARLMHKGMFVYEKQGGKKA